MNLTRRQCAALGIALIVDLVLPFLLIVTSMARYVPVGAAVAGFALTALGGFILYRTIDRQPGRLGLPESVTGLKVAALALVLIVCAIGARSVQTIALNSALLLFGFALAITLIVFAVKAGDSGLVGGAVWLWVLLIIFGGALGMLVFWYLNVWRGQDVVAKARLTSASS